MSSTKMLLFPCDRHYLHVEVCGETFNRSTHTPISSDNPFLKAMFILAFQKNSLIYACLPLVEGTLELQPSLLTILGLLQGLGHLLGIFDYTSPSQKNETEMSAKIGQLQTLFNQTCLLGTPLNTNISSLHSSFDDIQEISADENQPPWRSSMYEGKPQVNVCMAEKVKCMEYNKRDVVDVWQVYGAVNCRMRTVYVQTLPKHFSCKYTRKVNSSFYFV
ncbi:LOW QUALITY PROTEIN: AP-5 complex subunit mu-1 [Cuculus canorus]|uniref:LOW QUALITY PROTEIN: AP-5 complex subunit mu-1 n=1 Tax=Cuculus canorus TaxID=55661 RepID=UPI0023AAB31B|nr:LOW QUALITY PROTEIN: AP-5 complex subunit mu-1 [Cuculus canorus]